MKCNSSNECFIENLTYLRHRTGVIELPESEIPWADDFARQNGLITIDWIKWKLESIQKVGQTYLKTVSIESIRTDVEKIAEEGGLEDRLRAIIGLDIALSSQTNEELVGFWEWAAKKFRPQVGIVIILPRNANIIFPYTQREKWIGANRLLQIATEDTI